MGIISCGCFKIPPIQETLQRIAQNPDVIKFIASLGEKVDEFNKTFVEEVEKVKNELEQVIKSRHDKLVAYKKSKEGITEERIKELNKNELEKEIEVLANEVDKMHYIFDTGLEFVDVLRSITLNEFKSSDAPSSIIDEINKYTIVEFLKSTYGKVLYDAMVKKGLSETILTGVKNQIMENRGERRKAERDEFGIKNEFENEDINELKLNLMDLIESESNNLEQHFKAYARDKMIESMLSTN